MGSGCRPQPEGRDREHWEAAKEIWAFRSHDRTLPEEDAGMAQQTASSGEADREMR